MAFSQVMLVLLVVGVIFVNGWTDAPNAITCVVATGAMSYRAAVRLAAACNLLGLLVMSAVSSSVADTMLAIADFSGAPPQLIVTALCAAMLSIILFAVGAWLFGIPTSESHALIAALAGASLAIGTGQVSAESWVKVLTGLGMSLLLGFGIGYLLASLLGNLLSFASDRALDKAQMAGAAAMAFMHGAQDGQKFVAVFVLSEMLARGTYQSGPINMKEHIPALLLCALVMALGTAMGGHRIVLNVGSRMVTLGKPQAVCADLAGAACLLVASLTGIPMSTTHTKTTAIMGAGSAYDGRGLSGGVVGSMFLAWGVTFPVCGFLGYGLTRLFLIIS